MRACWAASSLYKAVILPISPHPLLGLPRSLVVVVVVRLACFPHLSYSSPLPCLLATSLAADERRLLLESLNTHTPHPPPTHPLHPTPHSTHAAQRYLEDEQASLVSDGAPPPGGSSRRMALAPASEATLPPLPVLYPSSCPRRYAPPPSLPPQLLAGPGGKLRAGGRRQQHHLG